MTAFSPPSFPMELYFLNTCVTATASTAPPSFPMELYFLWNFYDVRGAIAKYN